MEVLSWCVGYIIFQTHIHNRLQYGVHSRLFLMLTAREESPEIIANKFEIPTNITCRRERKWQ